MPMAVGFLEFAPERFLNLSERFLESLGKTLNASSIARADALMAPVIVICLI